MGIGLWVVGYMLMKAFCVVLLIGLILFVVWAMRALSKKELKKLVQGLIIVGILGMLLTGALMMQVKDVDGKYGFGDKVRMMDMDY